MKTSLHAPVTVLRLMTRWTGNFPAIAALVLLVWGCEELGPAGAQVTTPSIEPAPFYFSLSSGAAVTGVPDLTFKLEDGIYIVALNSAASVSAMVRTSADSAWLDDTDTTCYPGG